MKLSINALRMLIVGLVLGLTQAAYIIPAGGVFSMIIVVFVYLSLSQASFKSITFYKDDIPILFVIFLMGIMGVMLLIFGEEGDFKSRNFFLWSIIQLAVISSVLALSYSRYQMLRISQIISLLVFIEIAIIFDQFLKISYGIGFSTIKELNETLVMVTGSMTNPNDSATYIGLMLLALTAFHTTMGENKKSIILLIIALPAVFLTLSRTILVFWVLNLIAVILCTQRPFWNILKLIALCCVILLIERYIFDKIINHDSAVILRSMDKIWSISDIGNDDSINFRIVSHVRLLQNLSNLGFGSFSDLNYAKFFDNGDQWLMSINPHSFLVEYSFLFGYFGLLIALILFYVLAKGLMLNKDLPIPFKMISVFAIFLMQAIPSSVLSMSFYIMPFVFISRIKIH